MSDFSQFLIQYNASIRDALFKIDANQNNFLIVEDNGKILSVITDGDIRRLLLRGDGLEDKISINNNFLFLDYKDKFPTVCEKFKSKFIKVLPILKQGKLFNIITKSQFHALLLEDLNY